MKEEYFYVDPHFIQDVIPDGSKKMRNADDSLHVAAGLSTQDESNYLDVDATPTTTPHEISCEREAKGTCDILWNSPAERRIGDEMAKMHHSLAQHKAHRSAQLNGLENGLYDDGLNMPWSSLTRNPLYKGGDQDDTLYSTVEQFTESLPTLWNKDIPVSLSSPGSLPKDQFLSVSERSSRIGEISLEVEFRFRRIGSNCNCKCWMERILFFPDL